MFGCVLVYLCMYVYALHEESVLVRIHVRYYKTTLEITMHIDIIYWYLEWVYKIVTLNSKLTGVG